MVKQGKAEICPRHRFTSITQNVLYVVTVGDLVRGGLAILGGLATVDDRVCRHRRRSCMSSPLEVLCVVAVEDIVFGDLTILGDPATVGGRVRRHRRRSCMSPLSKV